MRVPFRFGRSAPAAACLLIAACAGSPADEPRVLVERAAEAGAPLPMESRSATLRQAARSLDTLFALPADAPPAATAVMAALRDVRNGRLTDALQTLAPVAAHTDSAADVARTMLGELLLHHGQWAALAGAPGGTAPLFAAFAQAAPEEWSFPDEPAVLPLDVTAVGTAVVDVVINGITHAFWIDTGAGLTVVSSRLAADAGIPIGDPGASAGTATSRDVATRPAIIDELRIGPVVVRNHPAIVIDAADLRFQAPELPGGEIEIHGILGWPIIRELDLTIDFAARRLTVQRPAQRATSARNFFWLGYPAVAARTENGRPLLLGLDTGAARSALAPAFLEAAGVRPDGTRSRRVGGAGGFETITVQTLDSASLLLDHWRLRFRHVDVHDQNVTRSLDLDGVLGSDIAAGRVLRLDFQNGRLELLDPA